MSCLKISCEIFVKVQVPVQFARSYDFNTPIAGIDAPLSWLLSLVSSTLLKYWHNRGISLQIPAL